MSDWLAWKCETCGGGAKLVEDVNHYHYLLCVACGRDCEDCACPGVLLCCRCERPAVGLVRDSSYCWLHLPAWSVPLVLVARARRRLQG